MPKYRYLAVIFKVLIIECRSISCLYIVLFCVVGLLSRRCLPNMSYDYTEVTVIVFTFAEKQESAIKHNIKLHDKGIK